MSRKNYTEREKNELLSVVRKYKFIIENKSTNAVSVQKKNETWEKIAQEFNAGAEYPRTAKQLNTAYQNLKRITRQKVAEENMQNYMLKSEDLKRFKKDDAEDKKALKATGGGTFTPALSEVGAQMLSLMGDQLKPLSNNCDSASEYYRVDEHRNDDAISIEIVHSTPMLQENEHVTEIVEEPTPPLQVKKKSPKSSSLGRKHQGVQLKQKKIFENNAAVTKKKFYQKKLECALIEKKIKMAQYKLALKNNRLVDLEIKIKELQYSSLLKST